MAPEIALEQLIGFAQRSSDDAWLNSNTHTAEVFTAIAESLSTITALQSSLTRVEGEHERLKAQLELLQKAATETPRQRRLLEIEAEWGRKCEIMTATHCAEDFSCGETITVLRKHRAWLEDDLHVTALAYSALVSSLTRLLEGGYTQHKPTCGLVGCMRCGGDHRYGADHLYEGSDNCTCDYNTLLATLTRLARSPEEK